MGEPNSAKSQRDAFLAGAGDDWYLRNPDLDDLDVVDRFLARNIGLSKSILEVGCGDGRRLRRLSKDGQQRLLIGVDPSERAVAAGREKGLDLRVGTADELPRDLRVDTVVFGFCLYLVDPQLLTKVVSEADRVLLDGGLIVIVDFDSKSPRRRRFRHHPGLWSHKLDWQELFTVFPHFILESKVVLSGDLMTGDDRVCAWLVRKSLEVEVFEESDG